MASSPSIISRTSSHPNSPLRFHVKSKLTVTASVNPPSSQNAWSRRIFTSVATNAATVLLSSSTSGAGMLLGASPAQAAEDDEYVKETEEVIAKIRNTINLGKNDPSAADAVAELRNTSNSWVAKYRRDKNLLGRVSFRDMYSALNAVSGHYISFGPTAPIPAKRKARILEEMATVEKALLRGK